MIAALAGRSIMLDIQCFLFLTALAATQAAVIETPHMLDDRAFEKLMTAFRRRGIDDWASRWKTEKHRRYGKLLSRDDSEILDF